MTRRLQQLTTGQAFGLAAGALTVVALVFFVAGALALARLADARAQLIDRVVPARITAEDLRGALIDQETGVRGFLLGRQERFLEPFVSGTERQAVASRRLRALTRAGGLDGTGEELDASLRAAAAWRDGYARPTIALGRRRAAGDADTALASQNVGAGKARFDAFRAELRTFTGELTRLEGQARAAVDSSITRVNVVFYGLGAILLLSALAAAITLQRGVTAPIGRLAARVRSVAEGRYDAPIEPGGLADARQLASDVDAMRERIVTELATVERANRELETRRADLERSNDELEEQRHQLERSNAELEQFAYVASHDLQEPLRKIASFSQLLQRRYGGQLDERADQYLNFSVDGARRMQVLINDLLAFSRVGRLSAGEEEVDLDAALDQALSSLGSATAESGAQITRDPLPVVQGEAPLLTLVLQNLVANAIKFRRPGTAPQIAITVRRAGDEHELTVADDGIGIDAEYAERIFVIFQRLHTREAYEGTGIGLAMCRKIVEHHGGRIWLDVDRPAGAHGTTVHFTLPIPHPEEATDRG